jgi:hypothetical protein
MTLALIAKLNDTDTINLLQPGDKRREYIDRIAENLVLQAAGQDYIDEEGKRIATLVTSLPSRKLPGSRPPGSPAAQGARWRQRPQRVGLAGRRPRWRSEQPGQRLLSAAKLAWERTRNAQAGRR